ncbi:hypothetical protein SC1083_2210 [Aggregatibacter actinomycetemcomitans serotype e str. SC1083]|uniref:Uncharacterized protein n=1 Tax=Aggregatibacter actinomycetemcomitans serotype e str. SC1083 TaxID=907488 RepID=G4ABH5_AGGAC|nr:hypothetical protein SC1083_2210 [Aggregatibacter actinomycetemcomitans serotype e str. SC1083]
MGNHDFSACFQVTFGVSGLAFMAKFSGGFSLTNIKPTLMNGTINRGITD